MESADPLLVDLDESQARAVGFADPRPLCVLAGPGSGKTRVLTRRIAHRCATGSEAPNHTVAVTFTRKAALELRHRLDALGLHDGVTTGTLHSLAYAELRRRWRDKGAASPSLLTRTTRAVADLLPADTERGLVRRVAEEVTWASAVDLSPREYAAETERRGHRGPLAGREMAELLEAYAEWKDRRNVVDFDDLLRLFRTELLGDEEYQAAIRWRHRHFYVDEFQDLNPLQFSLVRAWSSTDLFVVGDPNQAIYGWNGADSSYLTNFTQHFPEAEVIRLESSYRSTPEILAGAYAVLDPGGSKVQPRCTRLGGELPGVSAHPDERDEAAKLARRVRDQRGPQGAWSSQAILVRTRDQIPVLAEALRKAGIPHVVRDDIGFANLPEIAETLDAFARSDRALATEVADLRAEIVATEAAHGDQEERADNLRSLCELGQDHLQLDPEASARAFVNWVRATYRNQGIDAAGDTVEILTFHAAKGLEWSSVHIAGAERGLIPIHHATTRPERAEERRLLFVAMTRAQQRLHISWAETREFNGEVFERSRSPLLTPLLESCCSFEEEAQHPEEPPAGLEAARAALRGARED